MRVPINAPILGEEEFRAAEAVLREGALTNATAGGGARVRGFERAASDFLNCRYAVAVNSGTAALQAALLALGVGPGDEVILPSFTFVATANAVVSTGARPVFADIGEDHTVDPAEIGQKITKKTKAIIPVHLYGHVSRMGEIMELASRHSIPVLEDAAQSMGSTLDGRQTGTMGRLGCFSLYPAKVIASGEGGLVVTNSRRLYDKLRMIRNHGMVRGYDSRVFGLNLRMPEIAAAIAEIQTKRLPSFLKQRRKNAAELDGLLSGQNVKLPVERDGERANWYMYTISANRRKKLAERLRNAGIGAGVYYPVPVHRIPFYRTGLRLPATERAARRVLSLPVHPNVKGADISLMAKTISEQS